MPHQQHSDFWAGGFLYNHSEHAVFLHLRDGNTQINPHKWSFFGGQSDAGESYLDCFVRELWEEIRYRVEPSEARLLREYINVAANQYRVVFYVESTVTADRLVLGEGADFAWFPVKEAFDLELSPRTREDLEYFASLQSRL